jgi:hypothetical protein
LWHIPQGNVCDSESNGSVFAQELYEKMNDKLPTKAGLLNLLEACGALTPR